PRLRGARTRWECGKRHRPAEPDLARTSEGSRPRRLDAAVPGLPQGRHHSFRAEVESPVKLIVISIVAAMLGGCGSTNELSPAPTGTSSSSSSLSPSAAVSASPSPPPTATVRLALDWTPNTDHPGFFVARAKG